MIPSCASKQLFDVGRSGDFCDLAKPIHAKSTDDKQTKDEVLAHNQIGIQMCGWTK